MTRVTNPRTRVRYRGRQFHYNAIFCFGWKKREICPSNIIVGQFNDRSENPNRFPLVTNWLSAVWHLTPVNWPRADWVSLGINKFVSKSIQFYLLCHCKCQIRNSRIQIQRQSARRNGKQGQGHLKKKKRCICIEFFNRIALIIFKYLLTNQNKNIILPSRLDPKKYK